MPAGFRFPLSIRDAVYIPLHIDQGWMKAAQSLVADRRTRRGWREIEQAQADLANVFANLSRAYPDSDAGRVVHLQKLAENVTAKTPWAAVDAASCGAGCTGHRLRQYSGSGAGARRQARARDGDARSHWRGTPRLLGQVLTEGLLLAALGAVGGVLLASLLLDLMRAFLIKALARGADIHMNWTVLAAAVGIAVVASLAASMYPALRLSAIDPNRALKAGGSAGTERSQHRLRSGFVVMQIALTLMLLVVAGMLIRVVTRYRHVDLGFDPAHILSVKLNISRVRYQRRDVLASFYRPLEERVGHLPGVEAAGFINILPIESGEAIRMFTSPASLPIRPTR